MKTKVALAISGGGRTLSNLLEQSQGRAYEIAAIISSKSDCPGLTLAQERGLPVLVRTFPMQASSDLCQDLESFLQQHQVEWIGLAGFLRPFPVLSPYRNKIINIHPALLPNYGGKGMFGMNVHRAVFASQDTHSGATIHFVDEHYDEGAIIAQIKVSLHGAASPEEIATRVFAAECQLYPETLDKLCRRQLPLPPGHIYQLSYS